jgi:hypothetical protein
MQKSELLQKMNQDFLKILVVFGHPSENLSSQKFMHFSIKVIKVQ